MCTLLLATLIRDVLVVDHRVRGKTEGRDAASALAIGAGVIGLGACVVAMGTIGRSVGRAAVICCAAVGIVVAIEVALYGFPIY